MLFCFGCEYLRVPNGMIFSFEVQQFAVVDLYGFRTVSLRKELDLELAFAWLDLGQLKKYTKISSHVSKRLPAKKSNRIN